MTNGKKIITRILDGTLPSGFISRNTVLMVVITFLTLVYITTRLEAEKTYIKIAAIKEENKILKTAAALSASKLMFESKESEVLRLVKEKDLKLYSPSEPPFKLYVPTYKQKK